MVTFFMDLSNVFDTLNVELLIVKLEGYSFYRSVILYIHSSLKQISKSKT